MVIPTPPSLNTRTPGTIAHYFHEKTRELINIKLYPLVNKNKSIKYVDIVRDILCYVPLHWAATELVHTSVKLCGSGDHRPHTG